MQKEQWRGVELQVIRHKMEILSTRSLHLIHLKSLTKNASKTLYAKNPNTQKRKRICKNAKTDENVYCVFPLKEFDALCCLLDITT